MKITKKYINKVIKSGNWMIRTDKGGTSHDGFVSKPMGKKTICPDWENTPECGHGLHGQAREASGYNRYTGENVKHCLLKLLQKESLLTETKLKFLDSEFC